MVLENGKWCWENGAKNRNIDKDNENNNDINNTLVWTEIEITKEIIQGRCMIFLSFSQTPLLFSQIYTIHNI